MSLAILALMLPFHIEMDAWAMRDTITFPGRASQYTRTHEITPR